MRALLLPFVLAVAVVGGAAADHCTTYATSSPTAYCLGWLVWGTEGCVSGDVAGRYYIQQDVCEDCSLLPWIYQESNGIAGLERGDEAVDDTCHGSIAPDTLVF